MSESYQSYVTRGEERIYVSTVESEGGSLPMGETVSPWVGETCAWVWNPETKARGEMVFGPDYHHENLLDRHIESIRAVIAGYAYISDHRDAEDEDYELPFDAETRKDLAALNLNQPQED